MDTLSVPAGTTLDLNGLNVYAHRLQIASNVSNGVVTIVDGESTTTTVTASAASAVYGLPVTFTAAVVAGLGIPTGSVQFLVDGVNYGPSVTLNVSGIASLTTSTLSVRTHAISAVTPQPMEISAIVPLRTSARRLRRPLQELPRFFSKMTAPRGTGSQSMAAMARRSVRISARITLAFRHMPPLRSRTCLIMSGTLPLPTVARCRKPRMAQVTGLRLPGTTLITSP